MKVVEQGRVYEILHLLPDTPETSYAVYPPQQIVFAQKVLGKVVSSGTNVAGLIEVAIAHAKYLQSLNPGREQALVITQLETALLWLRHGESLKQ